MSPSANPSSSSSSSSKITSKFFAFPSVRRGNATASTRPARLSSSSPPYMPPSSHNRAPDPSIPPPTVSQIAMGLHLSRTPHLRKPKHPSPPLPPPPSRSALKASNRSHKHSSSLPALIPAAAASHTSSTVTSQNRPYTSPDKSVLSSRSGTSNKSRLLSRLIPSYNSIITSPSSNSTSDTATEAVGSVKTPKKAVRFSTSSLALKDNAHSGVSGTASSK